MTFVLLCPRKGEEVLEAEYQDFLRFTGLQGSELEQRPLDHAGAELGSMEHIEGVFIGGSPFTITEPEDAAWQDVISKKLVDFIVAQLNLGEAGIPVFCTCYGTSMLAHYLGGAVSQEYAEPASASTAFLTDAGRQDPLARHLDSPFRVMTGHKDSVITLPPGATLLATSPTCPVQMYRLGDRIWTTQFHPEMDSSAIITRLSFYEDSGYVAPGELDTAYAALRGHDTTQANSLLRNFVEHVRSRS